MRLVLDELFLWKCEEVNGADAVPDAAGYCTENMGFHDIMKMVLWAGTDSSPPSLTMEDVPKASFVSRGGKSTEIPRFRILTFYYKPDWHDERETAQKICLPYENTYHSQDLRRDGGMWNLLVPSASAY